MPNDIMVFMPFEKSFDNVYETIKRAVDKFNSERIPINQQELYQVKRIDQVPHIDSIVEILFRSIETCLLYIADLTEKNSNVMIELGYARALRKRGIHLQQTDKSGLDLPFDIAQINCLHYSTSNLAKLEEDLITQLMAAESQIEAQWSTNTNPAFSQSLAYSVSTPCYFLDNDFNITFMNRAAKRFFSIENEHMSLSEFSDHVHKRIKNMCESEKKLQCDRFHPDQSRRIISVEEMAIETDFGLAHTKKIGHQVFDPSTNNPVGWAVSFNTKEWKETKEKKPADFFDAHVQSLKEAKGYAARGRSAGELPFLKSLNSNEVNILGKLNGLRDIKIQSAASYSEKRQAIEFALAVMMEDQDRYGLRRVELLENAWFCLDENRYYIAKINYPVYDAIDHVEIAEGSIVGVLRIHPATRNLKEIYRNLSEEFTRDIDNATVYDFGAYIHKECPDVSRKFLLSRLLFEACSSLDRTSIVYGQVRENKFGAVQHHFGFKKAGEQFQSADAWAEAAWVPVYVEKDVLKQKAEQGLPPADIQLPC